MKILIFGLPGAGKTTLATQLAAELGCVHFNADEIRSQINKDLGFTPADREEQARRMGVLCDIVLRNQELVIADFVCPTIRTREIFNPDVTIWMNTIEHSRFPDTDNLFEQPSQTSLTIARMTEGFHLALDLIRRDRSNP